MLELADKKLSPKGTKNAKKKRPALPPATGHGGQALDPNVAAAGEGRKYIPVTVSLDQPLTDRLDDYAHKNRLTRSKAARAVLNKGLPK